MHWFFFRSWSFRSFLWKNHCSLGTTPSPELKHMVLILLHGGFNLRLCATQFKMKLNRKNFKKSWKFFKVPKSKSRRNTGLEHNIYPLFLGAVYTNTELEGQLKAEKENKFKIIPFLFPLELVESVEDQLSEEERVMILLVLDLELKNITCSVEHISQFKFSQ